MSIYVNAECTECRTASMCLVVGDECFCEACLEYVEACDDIDDDVAPLPEDLDDDECDDDFEEFDDDFPMELEYDDWRHDFNYNETDY